MNIFWNFLVLLIVFTPARSTENIEFYDCGSPHVVHDVNFADCDHTPCRISPGTQAKISLRLDYVQKLDQMSVDSSIYIYGNKFVVESAITNPCVSGCPLRAEIHNANITLSVNIQNGLIRRPGELVINATYQYNEVTNPLLCVGFEVDIV